MYVYSSALILLLSLLLTVINIYTSLCWPLLPRSLRPQPGLLAGALSSQQTHPENADLGACAFTEGILPGQDRVFWRVVLPPSSLFLFCFPCTLLIGPSYISFSVLSALPSVLSTLSSLHILPFSLLSSHVDFFPNEFDRHLRHIVKHLCCYLHTFSVCICCSLLICPQNL